MTTTAMQKRAIVHGSERADTHHRPTGTDADAVSASDALGCSEPLVKLNVKLPVRLLRKYRAMAQAHGETFTSWIAAACADHYLSQRQRGRIEDLARQILDDGCITTEEEETQG